MIGIIDYGMGNLRSVLNAFQYWKVDVKLIDTADAIKNATKLVLPGVGSFREAMHSLTQSGLLGALHHAVQDDQKPILGICLGMQMMASTGYEDGWTKGLNWIEGEVIPLVEEQSSLSIPHIGFCDVKNQLSSSDSMFGEQALQNYYFCHSFKLVSNEHPIIVGSSHYGDDFVSAIQKNNMWGTQFHPEKSQSNGLLLIKRFIDFVSVT